jgi:hypothetical protein
MESSIITGDRRLSVEKWARKWKINLELASCVAKAVKEPEETPYLLERILKDFKKVTKKNKKEVRNALLRVQIHCSINSDSDPIKVSKQLFVAQILEKLLFGSNMLFGEEIEPEEKSMKKGKSRF